MVNTIIEIVQTGSTFTAFVLEPSTYTPLKVAASPIAESAKHIATTLYPKAEVVDTTTFAEEVQNRINKIIGTWK